MKNALLFSIAALILATPAHAAEERRCPNGKSPEAATWLSVAPPGARRVVT